MAQAKTQPKTFEDFIQIPYDGRITEFVNGEVVEVGAHDPTIVRIIKKLTRLLDNHIEAIGLDWEAIAESSTVETDISQVVSRADSISGKARQRS